MLSLEERLSILDSIIKSTTPEQLLQELTEVEAIGPKAEGYLEEVTMDLFKDSFHEQGFYICTWGGVKDGMKFDKKTIFIDKDFNVEAEYFYYKGQCNYLLSYGFNKESLGEQRKRKSHKAKKPFFSLEKGWYGYE